MLYVLVRLLLFVSLALAGASDNKDICSLLERKQTPELFATGMINSSLLLITSKETDFQVYELPVSSFSSDTFQLNLSSAKPTALKDKYPKLFGDPNFGSLSEVLTMTVQNNESEHNYLVIYDVSKKITLVYDVESGNMANVSGVLVDVPFDSKKPQALFRRFDEPHSEVFQFISNEASQLNLFRFEDFNSNLEYLNLTYCLAFQNQTSSIKIVLQNSTQNCTEKALDWPARHGWKIGPVVVLLGSDQVHFFSLDPPGNAIFPNHSYSSFFKCSKPPLPSTHQTSIATSVRAIENSTKSNDHHQSTTNARRTQEPSTTESDKLVLVIGTAVVIGLVILMAIICVCCCCDCAGDTKEREQKSLSQSKQHGTKKTGSQKRQMLKQLSPLKKRKSSNVIQKQTSSSSVSNLSPTTQAISFKLSTPKMTSSSVSKTTVSTHMTPKTNLNKLGHILGKTSVVDESPHSASKLAAKVTSSHTPNSSIVSGPSIYQTSLDQSIAPADSTYSGVSTSLNCKVQKMPNV